MPDIGYLPLQESHLASRRGCGARRAMLIGAIVAGAALAAAATPVAETARAVQAAGPDLTRLLRAMAGLKLIFAAGLLAAVYWRLTVPGSIWRLACYSAAGAALAAGPVMIWGMVHVGLGALLLHGGLLAGGLLLWRDPAMGTLLDAAVTRRRAMRARG